jgi:hypothetical protein
MCPCVSHSDGFKDTEDCKTDDDKDAHGPCTPFGPDDLFGDLISNTVAIMISIAGVGGITSSGIMFFGLFRLGVCAQFAKATEEETGTKEPKQREN